MAGAACTFLEYNRMCENPYAGPDDDAEFYQWLYDEYGEITRQFPLNTVWRSTHPRTMGREFVVFGYCQHGGKPSIMVCPAEKYTSYESACEHAAGVCRESRELLRFVGRIAKQ